MLVKSNNVIEVATLDDLFNDLIFIRLHTSVDEELAIFFKNSFGMLKRSVVLLNRLEPSLNQILLELSVIQGMQNCLQVVVDALRHCLDFIGLTSASDLASSFKSLFEVPESPVILGLLGKSVSVVNKELDNLFAKRLPVVETFRRKHYLRNAPQVRDQEPLLIEKVLETLRKLSSAFITRVHCNEHSVILLTEPEGTIEFLDLVFFGTSLVCVRKFSQNVGDILQHSRNDPVKLIKAKINTLTSHTIEIIAHIVNGNLIRAVENHTLATDVLAKVLHSLGLASASGSSWSIM